MLFFLFPNGSTFDEVFRLRLSTYGAQERYEKSEKVLRDYNRALVLKHPRKLKSEKLLVILIISEWEESGYAAWKVIFLPNNLPLFADKGMLSNDKLGLFHPAK